MQREEMIILAGKYVLGLLSNQDAVDAEGRMETDPAFRSIVAQWQDRLADLDDLDELAEPIDPSSDLWERIVRDLRTPPDNDSHH
jgi:anti-sigma-K factor RskA